MFCREDDMARRTRHRAFARPYTHSLSRNAHAQPAQDAPSRSISCSCARLSRSSPSFPSVVLIRFPFASFQCTRILRPHQRAAHTHTPPRTYPVPGAGRVRCPCAAAAAPPVNSSAHAAEPHAPALACSARRGGAGPLRVWEPARPALATPRAQRAGRGVARRDVVARRCEARAARFIFFPCVWRWVFVRVSQASPGSLRRGRACVQGAREAGRGWEGARRGVCGATRRVDERTRWKSQRTSERVRSARRRRRAFQEPISVAFVRRHVTLSRHARPTRCLNARNTNAL